MESVAEEATRTPFPTSPTAEWELHKPAIHDLYIARNLPLKDVERELSERYHFKASMKQWKQQLKQWGFKKNLGAGEMTRIVDTLAKTNSDMLSNSYVEVGGLQVPLSRIKRHAQRTRSPLWRDFSILDAGMTVSPKRTNSASIADDITLVNGMDDETPKPILFAKDEAFSFSGLPLPISSSSNASDPYGSSKPRSVGNNARDVSCSRTTEPSSRRGSGPTGAKLFACPYFKHNPLKFSARNTTELMYRPCATVVLRNTAQIKQHLYRVHSLPDYYCEGCPHQFAKATDLTSPEYSCSCNTAPSNSEGKMTQDQYHRVKKRKTQPEQQNGWYEIFDILFPRMPKPASPYIEDDEDQESVNHFVNLFQSLGLTRTQELYNTVHPTNASQASIPPLPAATRYILDEAYDTFTRYHSIQFQPQQHPALPVTSPSCISLSSTRQNSLVDTATSQTTWLEDVFPAPSPEIPPCGSQPGFVDNLDDESWEDTLHSVEELFPSMHEYMEQGTADGYMDLDLPMS